MGNNISAIILAAGESRRMGQPKLLLPWGGRTVLGQVVSTFAAAGIEDIIVVTGAGYAEVEKLVAQLAREFPVRPIHNPAHAEGGMLGSIQAGLTAPGPEAEAALVGLGDQPQVQEETVRRVCQAFLEERAALVVPSCRNRRGHPWLAARLLWEQITALPRSTTARQFLQAHAETVRYVDADESVLQDLDTPEDYANFHP